MANRFPDPYTCRLFIQDVERASFVWIACPPVKDESIFQMLAQVTFQTGTRQNLDIFLKSADRTPSTTGLPGIIVEVLLVQGTGDT